MPRTAPGIIGKSPADSELVELLQNPPKALCIIGQMIAEHPNGDEIAAAVANERWSPPQLATVLSNKVQRTSGEAIARHRNNKCACER